MKFQLLNSLFYLSKGLAHSQIKECGFTDTECMICSYIFGNTNCSQDDVAKGICMDKTTIAKAVKGLEAKGYIARVHDAEDRRRNMLSITPEGNKKCEELLNLHDVGLAEIMDDFTTEEKEQFEQYCVRLVNKAKAMQNANLK